jgi:hypothetical protein
MRKRWLLLVVAALAASTMLVVASNSGANRSTVGTNVKVWIGLKNSDDVGTSFDLKAEVTNGSSHGYGTLPDFNGGSSGFNNAHPATIPVNYSGGAGGTVSVTLFVRVSCTSKHTSGTARLWWNDSQADSRVEDTGFGTMYLRGTNTLGSVGSGPKMTKDVLVKKNGCGVGGEGGTWQPFGTWTGTALPPGCTTLAANVNGGSTGIQVTSVSNFVPGEGVEIGVGLPSEEVKTILGVVTNAVGSFLIVGPLSNAHAAGEVVCPVD